MVEKKKSIYDDASPPFAEATHAADADLLRLDAESVSSSSQTQPLIEASSNTTPGAGAEVFSSGPPTTPEAAEAIPVIETEEEQQRRSRKIGAGVATGTLGFLVGGPILAVVFGFGTAYAFEKQGAAGDAARAVGDLAISAKEKAQEIDRKHRVVDKSKAAASEAWEKAREADRQHRILDRTRAFLAVSFANLTEFIRRHNLVERSVEGVGKAAYWVADKMAEQLRRVEERQAAQSRPEDDKQ